ncbi:MAG: hypothetical protein QNJ65_17865 [Xenococcaceae cyanobacterium MO_234.B1]|nr:hypothetical protein [Xenococcaceae cyanobacterium MO_234.B1]
MKIVFCEGLEVDGSQMLFGEYRVGLSSASKANGFSKEWLGRSLKRDGNQIETLQDIGFSGKTEKVATQSIKGQRESKTISLDDFKHLITYGVIKKKKKAISLQTALTRVCSN